MFEKIKTFCFAEKTARWVVVICLFVVIVLVSAVGFNDFVKPIFVYPEEEYQRLEIEARRVIIERTLNEKIKHDIIYSNDLESKSVEVKLRGEGARVTIVVDNYNEEIENIKVYRNHKNNIGYYIEAVVLLVISVGLFTLIFSSVIIAILFFIGVVCKALNWMFKAIRY